MVRVSGPLVNVTTSASSVRDVQVHTKKVRAWGDGLMTPDPSQATLSNGAVEFEAAPGPVVMVLFMAEAGAETVSLVVGEGATQSLADAYRDGQMANDRDAGELAGILEQIRESVGASAEARAGAEAAAEDAAGSAASAGRDAGRAETAEAGAVEAEEGAEAGQELSEDAAAVAVAAAIGIANSAWPKGAYSNVTLPSMDDAPEGYIIVNTNARSQAWGLPDGLLGFVRTYYATAFKVQKFYAISSVGPREYSRNQTNAGWSTWQRSDGQLDLAAKYADSGDEETLAAAKRYADSSGGGGQENAWLPLSRPWGTGSGHTRSYADFHARIPLNLQVETTNGIRLGFSNTEYITETIYTAPAVIDRVFVGQGKRGPDGKLTGEFVSDPIPLLTEPITLPADGSTVFTPWGAEGVRLGRDTIVSYGYTSDGASVYLYTHGTGWQSTSRFDAGRQTPLYYTGMGGTPTVSIPFVVGAEIKTTAPRVLVIGDSHMVALASGSPMVGSPAAIAAGAGWVPRIHAIGGTRYSTWANNTLVWDEVARSGADKVLLALGSNDLFGGGSTVADTQAHFLTVVGKIRTTVGDVPIHVMEVFPRNREAGNTDMTAMMEEFNSWLYTLPAGVQSVIPVGNIVDPATGLVDTRWISSDDVHLSLAGNVRLAQSFTVVGALS